jgi:hypothetical protein
LFWKEGEKKKDREKKERKKFKKKDREKKERKKKKKSVRKKKSAILDKNYQKIGKNFSRGKLERKLLVYPAWQLFHIIIFTAIVIFTYILLSRATSYPLLMLVVLHRDLISVLGSRL